MKFCTTINCMDGRVQEPVINFLKTRFEATYVDSITEPGPIAILAAGSDKPILDNLIKRIDISVNKHGSQGIAVAGHYDCAGNPVPKNEQLKQLKTSCEFLIVKYPAVEIIGLWVDDNWAVTEINFND